MLETGTDGLECLDPPPLGEDDPMEKVDLAGDNPSMSEEMSRQLHRWVEEHLGKDESDPMRIW